MNWEKDKDTAIEKVIQKGDLGESFNKEITSNNSEVPTEIPSFTTAGDDSSGGSEASGDESTD